MQTRISSKPEYISVGFNARLCYKFIAKKPHLQPEDEVFSNFLIGDSRKEYLQSKYFNHSRRLEEFLRGKELSSEPSYLLSNGKILITRTSYEYFKEILQLSGFHLEEKIISSLFLVREMLVPVFIEMQEEKFYLNDYRMGITEKYFTPAPYCDLGKQRPIDPEMQPYCDLIGSFYPHLFNLKGVKNEKGTVVLFGILLDTANFSRFIIEAEAKRKNIRDWLYRKVREKFYDYRNSEWKNPFKNKESTSMNRRKRQLNYFLVLFALLTDLKKRPDAPARELRISRTIANSLGIDRKSASPIPQSVIQRLTEYFEEYQSVFSQLNLWPGC
jgi:hypothetical protein